MFADLKHHVRFWGFLLPKFVGQVYDRLKDLLL